MKTYFDYESIIKSKDAAEAIAAPIGMGPFCGFGSAVVNNNTITISAGGEPTSPAYLAMKDRIVSRYMTKSSDSGESPETNFGCIARDGVVYISDSPTIVISNIEGSKGNNEDVIVFAYHTPLEEPIQNPVQFRAFWNESTSFYGLYKKSIDPLYPNPKEARVISKTNVLEDNELTYESLENRAMASISPGLIDKSSMVLVGIYGQGINALDESIEKYSIVPYGGRFPQPVDYNTAIHGMQLSNVEALIRILSEFPNSDIKAYIDEQLGKSKDTAPVIPRGLIAMWNGTQIPNGWALCNGQIVDDLQTPDLSGKFIVGWQSGEEDYSLIGNTGGQAKVTLSTPELPRHTHPFSDAYFIEHKDYPIQGKDGTLTIGEGLTGGAKADQDNGVVSLWNHDTKEAGGDQPHENRPPYYVLAYIIKL